MEKSKRRFPIGAEYLKDGVDFRIWAPSGKSVDVVIDKNNLEGDGPIPKTVKLIQEEKGYFSAFVPYVKAGMRYGFILDSADKFLPDPVSRYQPDGPFGSSQIIDIDFPWSDQNWMGINKSAAVIYEMHVGTFTKEGTFYSATRQLEYLKDLGISVIEMMPVAECFGKFNWGYDGVNLFAPNHNYGTPNDFRRFVDRAHDVGIAVILDVVYNHLGSEGNTLKQFSEFYFTNEYSNEWGEAMNFDGPHSKSTREFFVTNACYWACEFHLDGLRLDATQQMYDSSETHIVAEIIREMRSAANGRKLFIVAENETQDSRLLTMCGVDAIWNDDFHHSTKVAMTDHAEAYYSAYGGTVQELISCIKFGFLYQGQYCSWQKKRRGTPSMDLPPHSFIHFIQNHDQIANSYRGERINKLTSPQKLRAITALTILGPQLPMLFQGQEFGSSSPFYFFADHSEEYVQPTSDGRRNFLSQFESFASSQGPLVPIPSDLQTYLLVKIDIDEHVNHLSIYNFHKDLLKLRRDDPVVEGSMRLKVDGAVLDKSLFVIRYFGVNEGDDRLLVVNIGLDKKLIPIPEPLMAPPVNSDWVPLWNSERPEYGGNGTAEIYKGGLWNVAGGSLFFLTAQKVA